ncbi:MAG: RNA-binding protein [Methanobacteriaceae archaeon]|nr:RNA-binding protein [Candidatus Methanorudis spinitermitis]
MKIKKRYHLKKKKLKEIKNELKEYSDIISDKANVEMLETDSYSFILINSNPYIILINNKPFPTLKAIMDNNIHGKQVIVDMGAVKFMANGADVMSPGIVATDENIDKSDVVVIVDENHEKPLAIGISLITGNEMVKNDKGKAIKTIHFIGDTIWNFQL